MNKFIKHEFRATSRIVLPILLVFVVSGLLTALLQRFPLVPGFIFVIVTIAFVVSLMAIGVICLIVVISRFYRNTMTDDAYLTMTLPITEHEFIWGEIITNICWVIIIAAVVFATAFAVMQIAGIVNFFEIHISDPFGYLKIISDEIKQQGISWFSIISIGIQLILGSVVGYIAICLHIYCAMAIGQLFNRHRILMSVLAYIAIRIVLSTLFAAIIGFSGDSLMASADSIDGVNLILGLVNIMVAAGAAVLYVPTFLLIGKRINLT